MVESIIDLIAQELYLFIAFLCGLYLGYIIGKREND